MEHEKDLHITACNISGSLLILVEYFFVWMKKQKKKKTEYARFFWMFLEESRCSCTWQWTSFAPILFSTPCTNCGLLTLSERYECFLRSAYRRHVPAGSFQLLSNFLHKRLGAFHKKVQSQNRCTLRVL